ncbi:FlgD immunoglobulin-like domain containing protein [Gracilimonas mengyeensis]|uniref:Predicted secreted protein n=1 Tax=Gracilimonas mengyeensis TaxID=1302730 RepID=A0A521AGS5_9BACT|nr:FlgD immunoglobulin-like domain containing protein [Gracilimonas mengyeensis]SMO34002.1 Predicted secreted protein [Gracilimonas mengyeensis]
MKKTFILIFIFSPIYFIQAQVTGPTTNPYFSIHRNGVSTMEAYGDTLWISPKLTRNISNQLEWHIPQNADSLINNPKGNVFSLELGKDSILAGLGYTNFDQPGDPPTGFGYYFSSNGGQSWRYIPPQLDNNPPDELKCKGTEDKGEKSYPYPPSYRPECDIQVVYGGFVYNRIRFTVDEQSPPYEVDFKNEVFFSANWGRSLLRSTDAGMNWEPVLLPPDNVEEMTPEGIYWWNSNYIITVTEDGDEEEVGITVNRYDPTNPNTGLNLLAFSVEIDNQNRVWVGTAKGVNISENALTAPIDSISWRHISYDKINYTLLANWITNIRQEPHSDRVWMTNWHEDPPQREGLVYTADGGESFKQMLVGERINDIGFKDGYVFAPGNNGLFVSDDAGESWTKIPQIKSPNTFIKSSTVHSAVATTTNRVWIGTDDGLASIECCSENQRFDNWQITRVNYPLKGGNVHEPDKRNTTTYAYPNPFSSSVYELVRIKFEVKEQGNVRIRIFDFGMNLVREIENGTFTPGTYEAVWDGYDGKGRKVDNGPYIYIVETASRELSGKMMVVD